MKDLVKVEIDLTKPQNQVFSVSIKFRPSTKKLLFCLPVWTPGSYTIREHSQYLFDLVAYQDEEA